MNLSENPRVGKIFPGEQMDLEERMKIRLSMECVRNIIELVVSSGLLSSQLELR